MNTNQNYNLQLFFIMMLIITTACSSAAPVSPTETPIKPSLTTAPPTNTPLPPTSTPTQTSTPTPTPTETPTPSPTETPSPTPTETATPTFTLQPLLTNQVILKYFIHLGTGGVVACGDSLVAGSTGQLPSDNVVANVERALNSLFATGVQYVGNLYNPLYQSRLSVNNIDYKKSTGVMIVYLTGSFVKPKDNCDRQRYRAQVWQTIYQFPEVKRAHVWVNQHLLGDLLVPTK